MAKPFFKNFENLRGIDSRASDLTREMFYAKNLTNCRFTSSKAIRKRNGFECLGQAGGFVGGHNYVYFDTTSGETKQELLAINDNLWRLKTSSFTITRGSSTTWSTEVVVESSNRVFKLKEGTTEILSQSLGTGLEDIPYSIEELRLAIDALANYSCSSLDKWAKINGLQTGVSAITVDSSLDFAVGDVVSFWDYSTSKLAARELTAVGATTLTFSSSEGTVNVKDNQFIGKAATPAASLQMGAPQSTTGTTITISFEYWEPVFFDYIDPLASSRTPFSEMYSYKDDENFTPPSFLNTENICLIAYFDKANNPTAHEAPGRIFKYDGQSVYRAGLPTPVIAETTATTHAIMAGIFASGSVYKLKARYRFLDAKGRYTYGNPSNEISVTGAGAVVYIHVPFPAFADNNQHVPGSRYAKVSGAQAGVTTITVDVGHGILVGDSVVFYDAVGASHVRRTVTSIAATTVTISGANVTVEDDQTIFAKVYEKFPYYFALVASTPASPSTTLDVNDSKFRVNDVVLFNDANLAGGDAGRLNTRRVTARSTASVTIDVAAQSTTFEPASKGMTVELFCTEASGNVFYKLQEYMVGFTKTGGTGKAIEMIYSAQTIGDLTRLGEPLEEPPFGFEWDLPPKARHLTSFQGLPVATGDNQAPNNVYWPDIDNIEGWPLASNVASINSQVQGPVTAIGASSDDELFIFKSNAIYALYGSLAEASVSSRIISEGTWGVSSHGSLVTLNGTLIGIGALGVVRLLNGQIDPLFGYRINPLIRKSAVLPGETGFVMTQIHATSDPANVGYRFYIPYSGYTTGSAGSSLGLFLDMDRPDLSEPVWLDESFTSSLDPSRGWFVYKNLPCFLSGASGGSLAGANSGQMFREIRVSDTTYSSKNYYDNHLAITQLIRLPDLSIEEPSVDKEFLWLGIYSFLTSPDEGMWTTNSLAVTTYRNWQESTVSTSYTAAFLANTTFEYKQKLASDKARALRVLISNATAGESSYISGIEIILSTSYLKEEMRK